MSYSPTNAEVQAGEGTLSENGANTEKRNNQTSAKTGKSRRNKVASITHIPGNPNRKHQGEPQNHTHDTNTHTHQLTKENSRRTPNTTMVTQGGLLEDRTKDGRVRSNKDKGYYNKQEKMQKNKSTHKNPLPIFYEFRAF
jgi:hypothetical protein